jgi:hypothetical protein
MDDYSNSDDIDIGIVTNVISTFSNLTPRQRERLLQTVAALFNVASPVASITNRAMPYPATAHFAPDSGGSFSEDRSISPKEFLKQKQPRTDVERVACLGYYLTHYRDIPHFKTLDISKINTEAAQPKFANAAYAVDNATRNGYLVLATKGNKQLSAAGEQFVQELPDREAAKAIMEGARPRRKPRKSKQKKIVES